jgi:hypothetical protein
MQALAVVKNLDVLSNGGFCLRTRLKALVVDHFIFKASPKAYMDASVCASELLIVGI